MSRYSLMHLCGGGGDRLQATLNYPRNAEREATPPFRMDMEQSHKFFVSIAGRAFYARCRGGAAIWGSIERAGRVDMTLGRRGDFSIEGTGVLAGNDRKRGAPRIQLPEGANTASRKISSRPRDGNIGSALRSIYDEAVKENVPDEFLDLLSKLD